MSDENYLAHIAEDGRKQTVREHLEGTAKLCAGFASAFDAEAQGRLAGLAHDIGKYSAAFQKRLQDNSIRVDHSTAGLFECAERQQNYAAFAVAGHHGGLPDAGGRGDRPEGSSFCARYNRAAMGRIADYSAWRDTLPPADLPKCSDLAEEMFFTRMLYSCLVDADFLDTETFMAGQSRDTASPDMDTLLSRFREKTAGWFPPKGELNEKRCEILKRCMAEGASQEMGLFTLTVPTGGGKTAASLAFALEHAKKHDLQRIIYVIPYTSIIEQTAEKFREFLGEDVVLEHHSGILYDLNEEAAPKTIRMAKATENWDMPVVVTTAVQFFESLLSNRSSRCRKLHNLARSVIVFDEAQTLPLPYLRPCVWSIAQLVKRYGVSAVLCTATQPELGGLLHEFLPGSPVREICPPELSGWDGFRRVIFRREGVLDWQTLADRMNTAAQALCIVNSRKSAQTLFALLRGDGVFHLSTLMHPAHRRAKLAKIRQRLKKGLPCRVVSTSLIEAGVDVDFPLVFREEAGLDSILQAAGRCNREGKKSRTNSIVTVFKSENPVPTLFELPAEISRQVMDQNEDISSPEAIHAYFSILLDIKGGNELDKEGLIQLMKNGHQLFAFRTLAERVHLIKENTRTVYIPIGEGAELVRKLRDGERSRALFRKVGQYGVNVYQQHFDALEYAGVLEPLEDGSAILLDTALYSDETGLTLEPVESAFLNV